MPSMYCCSTAPAAISEASVIMLVGASSSGYKSKLALARTSLVALNADLAVSVQSSVSEFWTLLNEEVNVMAALIR